MTDTLREVVRTHLDAIDPPGGDLSAVTRRGRRLRRRRTSRWIAGGTVGVAAVVLAVTQIGGTGPGSTLRDYPRLAAFDLSHGLRAYASPDEDGPIHLGDKSFSTKGLGYLDTDASATPSGVVFFEKDQKPRLLGDDGKVVTLAAGPAAPVSGFHPSSKFDARRPLVAWTENRGDTVRVVLYDLADRSVVGTRDVPCSGPSCNDVKVDGLDRGVVFVRTSEGTSLWQQQDNSWTALGGSKLRVADVRNGVVLYHGTAPTLASGAWRYVRGEIDAQLTFDGKNILSWSSVLAPTTPGGRTIRLHTGGDPTDGFFTFDTDGSVLVARMKGQSTTDEPVGDDTEVFDCVVPSGACTDLGGLATRSGDPMFIGNDM